MDMASGRKSRLMNLVTRSATRMRVSMRMTRSMVGACSSGKVATDMREITWKMSAMGMES